MEFVPEIDMNAIDGAIADLAARTDRPQGYPFSRIRVFSVCPEVRYFMPHLEYCSASDVPAMRKLDFKKAGKVFGAKVQEMKNDLSQVSDEFIITASRFDVVDEPRRKTTGCRKHMIEVECEDQEDKWLAIQFRKSIKKYITEDMGINIVPPIFGDQEFAEYPIRLQIPSRQYICDHMGDCEVVFGSERVNFNVSKDEKSQTKGEFNG